MKRDEAQYLRTCERQRYDRAWAASGKEPVCKYCGEGVADGWRLDQLYEYEPGRWVCVCCIRKYE